MWLQLKVLLADLATKDPVTALCKDPGLYSVFMPASDAYQEDFLNLQQQLCDLNLTVLMDQAGVSEDLQVILQKVVFMPL